MQAKLKYKLCSACKEEKLLEEFNVHRATKDGRNTYCKYCSKKRTREWKENNPEKNFHLVKNNHYKYNYGITYNKYLELYNEQKGICSICKRYYETLHVDHSHDGLKQIRGLLCGPCNRGLGMFEDNPDYLDNAKEYLCRLN